MTDSHIGPRKENNKSERLLKVIYEANVEEEEKEQTKALEWVCL